LDAESAAPPVRNGHKGVSKPAARGGGIAGRKDYARSAKTNGTTLLGPGVDGRTHWARRAKDLFVNHLSDLGGLDNCSEAEKSLVRRAAVLTTELERLEVRFANAGEASFEELDLYGRTASHLRRLFEAVGIQRRPREVGPTFGDLVRADQQQAREREVGGL
jgi:hypothetical protein